MIQWAGVMIVNYVMFVNGDLFCQKLQALRSEYDKETMSLKRKVAELEKQLASTGTKRRKY